MNYFAIQTSNPVFKEIINEEINYLYEAIQKVFCIETENAYLTWNSIPVKISYTEDLHIMIDDILILLNSLLSTESGSQKVFWGSSSLNSEWSLDWINNKLIINAKWNIASGGYEDLLNSRNYLEIQKSAFLNEWKSLLEKIIEAIDLSKIKITNPEEMELLRKTEASIKNLGRLYRNTF